jgi:hypothetical protein
LPAEPVHLEFSKNAAPLMWEALVLPGSTQLTNSAEKIRSSLISKTASCLELQQRSHRAKMSIWDHVTASPWLGRQSLMLLSTCYVTAGYANSLAVGLTVAIKLSQRKAFRFWPDRQRFIVIQAHQVSPKTAS